MTEEIIISGFGGQGVLLAGKLLCVAAMRQGLHVSHIPSYGAEMRGGTANCSVVLSTESIASPVIEHPSIVIAFNGPSVTKFEPRIRAGGILLWNSSLVKNPPARENIQLIDIPATDISLEEGTERGANMVAIGGLLALKPFLVSKEAVINALDEVVSARNRRYNPQNERILQKGFDLMEKRRVREDSKKAAPQDG
ncbi:MAG: 2-oxoacid:ferredoxin oxidoreductase subunit gamma [spirochete symbiont of Stewartia floridana]|nr:MAG: 2-oxoacid:ferredoxin oxidoreductase subunit gamma [spirochete symbiont of Stewartia floridana]